MPHNILIVDDQEDILLILEREFRRRPTLSVTSASKSADALRLVAEKGIEMIICDVRLGGRIRLRPDPRDQPCTSRRRLHPDVGLPLRLQPPAGRVARRVPVPRKAVPNRPPDRGSRKLFTRKDMASEAAPAAEPSAPDPEPDPNALPPEAKESSGLLHFKPQDLVQLFCLNGRNILLTVASPADESSGEIYIQRGRVLHATYLGKTGDEAFHALMHIPNRSLRSRIGRKRCQSRWNRAGNICCCNRRSSSITRNSGPGGPRQLAGAPHRYRWNCSFHLANPRLAARKGPWFIRACSRSYASEKFSMGSEKDPVERSFGPQPDGVLLFLDCGHEQSGDGYDEFGLLPHARPVLP